MFTPHPPCTHRLDFSAYCLARHAAQLAAVGWFGGDPWLNQRLADQLGQPFAGDFAVAGLAGSHRRARSARHHYYTASFQAA